MDQLLLSNLRLVDPFGAIDFQENTAILIEDGVISSVGSLPADYTGVNIDMTGKTVMPGMINAHTHLYSSLALGMPAPRNKPGNFVEILKEIWWKLDLSLDEDATRASFDAGLLDCIRQGVTTVTDHHASPNYVEGSLDLLVRSAQKFGINIGVCFEVSDRNGEASFRAELDENLRAMSTYAQTPQVLSLLGLHASFTLSDNSLEQISEQLQKIDDWGIHIHVAEDLADERDARARGYGSVVQRLDHFGLLNERSLIVHGIFITEQDRDILRQRGCQLIHNPTSNAGNQVGILKAEIIDSLNAGLGTDGMQNNMLAEAREGALIRSAGGGPAVDYLQLLFKNNPIIASHLFGNPLGHLSSGHQADLVFFDYAPRTMLQAENYSSHLLWGLQQPSDVMSRGIFRMRSHEISEIDINTIEQNARAQSVLLWEKMQMI